MLSEFHKKKRVERYNKKNLLPTFLDVNSGWDDLLGPKNRYSEDFNGKCEKPGNEQCKEQCKEFKAIQMERIDNKN